MTYKRYILSLDFILEEDGKKIKVERLGAATLVVPVLQRADGTLMEANIRTEDFNHMADMVRQFIKTEETKPKQGLWIDKVFGTDWCQECSNCSYKNFHIRDGFNYCPNCGAKMDEE